MAITTTARFGLKVASAGTDDWPGRGGWAAMLQSLENNAAMFAQGTEAARPAPGKSGRFYSVSSGVNGGTIWYDTGAAWVAVGATLRSSVSVSDSAAAVPLTSRGASGQTADLQQWQNSAGSVLARVSASGQLSVANGTAATHAVTKAQLDAVVAGTATNLSSLPAGGNVSLQGFKLISLAPGTAFNDAVRKDQLDAVQASIPVRLHQLSANQNVAMSGYRFTGLGAGTAAGDSVNKAQLDAVQASIPTNRGQLPVTAHLSMADFRVVSVADGVSAGDVVTKRQLDSLSTSFMSALTWWSGKFGAVVNHDAILRTTSGVTLATLAPASSVSHLSSVTNSVSTAGSGWFLLNGAAVTAMNANPNKHIGVVVPCPADQMIIASAAFFDRSAGDWYFGYSLVVGSNVRNMALAAGYTPFTNPVTAMWAFSGNPKPSGVTHAVPFAWAAGDMIVIGAYNTHL